MSNVADSVKCIDFDEPEDFLSALRPEHELWRNRFFTYIFRGHAREEWPLVPSAVRPTNAAWYTGDVAHVIRNILEIETPFDAQTKQGRMDIAKVIALASFSAELEFLALADELGLVQCPEALPNKEQRHTRLMEVASKHTDFADFVQRVTGPSIWTTLAQHHGICTRLLDWTTSATTAAHFAVADIPLWGYDDDEDDDLLHDSRERFCVWAMPTVTRFVRDDEVDYFAVPASTGGYIRSQRGSFTWHRRAEKHFVATGIWPCLSQVVQTSETSKGKGPWLIKLTLPRHLAYAVRNYLRLEGLTASHLRPTLDNVAATVNTDPLYATMNMPMKLKTKSSS